mmetsp:Transcript_30087/g.44320  ORF Transcript_30087/g.44320 Transcript_30087/m.44320 type:complete len:150 (-) Transcript_30087:326-775(-)
MLLHGGNVLILPHDFARARVCVCEVFIHLFMFFHFSMDGISISIVCFLRNASIQQLSAIGPVPLSNSIQALSSFYDFDCFSGHYIQCSIQRPPTLSYLDNTQRHINLFLFHRCSPINLQLIHIFHSSITQITLFIHNTNRIHPFFILLT